MEMEIEPHPRLACLSYHPTARRPRAAPSLAERDEGHGRGGRGGRGAGECSGKWGDRRYRIDRGKNGCTKGSLQRTEDDDTYVNRAEDAQLMRLFEESVLALLDVDADARRGPQTTRKG